MLQLNIRVSNSQILFTGTAIGICANMLNWQEVICNCFIKRSVNSNESGQEGQATLALRPRFLRPESNDAATENTLAVWNTRTQIIISRTMLDENFSRNILSANFVYCFCCKIFGKSVVTSLVCPK